MDDSTEMDEPDLNVIKDLLKIIKQAGGLKKLERMLSLSDEEHVDLKSNKYKEITTSVKVEKLSFSRNRTYKLARK